MPTDENILGFSNRWYPEAVKEAIDYQLTPDITIRLISGPYFLATKIDAFHDRGRSDYLASHDLEDAVVLIDGRPEIVDEVQAAPSEAREFLVSTVRDLLKDEDFLDAVPGYLRPDAKSQARVPALLPRMEAIARL